MMSFRKLILTFCTVALSACTGITDGPSLLSSVNPTSNTPSETWTDNTAANFAKGTSSGLTWDVTNSYMRLDTSSQINNSGLDSSWTPQWSHVVGYWKMDNNWTDSTANHNDGTAVSAPTFSAIAKVGATSGSFNGTTDYVSVPNSASLSFTNEFTVMTWIFISSSSTNFWLFSKNPPGFGSGYGIAFENGSGRIWPHLGIGGALRNPKSSGGTAFGQWNQIVITYDGSNIVIYLNGRLDSTIAQMGAFDVNNGPLYIGNSPGSPTEFLNGKIDDLALWDKALTDTEVRLIYSRQQAKYGGTFESRVYDAQSSITWPSLAWSTTLPFGKELTGDADGDTSITASDSESTTSYTSLVSSTLMSGLKRLWHFNESALSSGGAGNDFKDDSGQNRWLTAGGTMTLGAAGRLQGAVQLDGATGGASGSDASLPSGSSARTVSTWVKPYALPTAGNQMVVFAYGSMNVDQAHGIYLYNNAGTQNLGILGWGDDLLSATSLPLNEWSHIVTTYSGTTATLYLNGIELTHATKAAWNTVLSGNLRVGKNLNNTSYFNGTVDELGVWSRALSAQEVLQLYRRGANRVFYQVRSCSDSICTAGSPAWLGPDGTSQTYFSELYNRSSNSLTGLMQTGLPTMLFPNFGAPLSTSLITNRYFQYRTVMESDDVNALCNYGSGAVTCSPELKQVGIGH